MSDPRSDANLRIKIDNAKMDILNSREKPNVEVAEYQLQIFETMSKFLTRYFDTDNESIYNLILHSAKLWQDTNAIPFSQFKISLPQERLKMAEQFKDDAISVFGDVLANGENFENFKATMEHALLFYMREYASR